MEVSRKRDGQVIMMTSACETPQELASYLSYDHRERLSGTGIDVTVMTPIHFLVNDPPHVHLAEAGGDRYEMYSQSSHGTAIGGLAEAFASLGLHVGRGMTTLSEGMSVTHLFVSDVGA